MKYCKKCVNPSTRPGIIFDEEDVCMPCRFAERRAQEQVDWAARRRELEEIARWGRERSKSSYDCIVPVSGGKDSTRQALYVRDELGLKPLLVSLVYPPEQLSERGAYNISNLLELGFDAITVSLNPQLWKRLMRDSFYSHANWCKSTELALYSSPIHVAIAYHIPLVFLGENPAYTVGESEGSLDGDANRMKYCNTLEGGRADRYLCADVSRQDLYLYNYPSDAEMDRVNLRIVYLGYYMPDFNILKNAEVAIAHGLQVRHEPPEAIGDLWGFTSLDEDFRLPNQMIKHVKLGYGYVTDQAAEAIGLGVMTREEGVELVRKYDGKCDPSYIERFSEYLGISVEEFWNVVERFRDHDIWEKDEQGQWRLKVRLE